MEFDNISLITEVFIPNIDNYITLLEKYTTAGAESTFTKLRNSMNNLQLPSFTESV